MNFLQQEKDIDYFIKYNKDIASKLFTEEEITLFKIIYNNNFFDKLKDPTLNLFKGIDIKQVDDSFPEDYKSFEINELLIFNDNNNVYTDAFKQNIIDIDNIINNKGHNDNLKYILIGHKLQDFNCNTNNNRFRLVKHILNYCMSIKHNKSILLREQEHAIQRAASIIGNCDFENLESFSIKEIEDWFRGIPDIKKEDFFDKIESIKSIGSGFTNKLKNILGRLKGNRESVNTTVTQIVEQPQQELTEIKNKMDKLRMNIMSLDELNRNNFCTDYEMALTYEKYKTSEKWLTNPQLVAFAGANATMTIQSIIKTHDVAGHNLEGIISRNLTSSIDSHALATFVTTALGPLVGLFIGIGVSYFLDSKFYKDLRSTRQINLNFINWISKHSFLIDTLQTSSSCSYRISKEDYERRVESATLIIDDYLEKSNEHFNKHIKKLEFYLYAYYYRCKIIHQQNVPLERPVIGQKEQLFIADTIEKANKPIQEKNDQENINDVINIRISNNNNDTNLRKGYLSGLYNELPQEKRNDFLNKIDATLNVKSDNGKFTIKKLNENKEQLIKNLQEFYKENDYPKKDEFYGGIKTRKNHKKTKQRNKRNKRRTSRK